LPSVGTVEADEGDEVNVLVVLDFSRVGGISGGDVLVELATGEGDALRISVTLAVMSSAITVEDGVALGVVDKSEVSSEEERLLVLMLDVPLSVSVVPDAALVVCWPADSGTVTSNEDVLVVLTKGTPDVVLPTPATPPVEEEVLTVLASDNATDGELPSSILFGLEVIVTSEEDGSVVLISTLDGELPILSAPLVGDIVLVTLVRNNTSGEVEAVPSTLLELEEMVTSEEGVLLIVLCDGVPGVAVTSGIGLLVLLAPTSVVSFVSGENADVVSVAPLVVLIVKEVTLSVLEVALTSEEEVLVISFASGVVPVVSLTLPELGVTIPALDVMVVVLEVLVTFDRDELVINPLVVLAFPSAVAVAGVALGDVVTSEGAILVVLAPGEVLSVSVLLRLGTVTSGEGLPLISSVVVPAVTSGEGLPVISSVVVPAI
ncbi:unnamed protein product, partial [Strongylus vulgaris]